MNILQNDRITVRLLNITIWLPMEEKSKKSAGCIVINPETKEMLVTRKLSQYKYKANIMKAIIKILHISPEKALHILKGWFTKGKIELGHTILGTAIKETIEEWWISADDLNVLQQLWSFIKTKKYGYKEVYMLLWTTHKKHKGLKPTDSRHIAAFIDIQKVPEILQSEEEKTFLWSIQEEIQEILNTYNNETLPIKNIGNVIKVDTWIIR